MISLPYLLLTDALLAFVRPPLLSVSPALWPGQNNN